MIVYWDGGVMLKQHDSKCQTVSDRLMRRYPIDDAHYITEFTPSPGAAIYQLSNPSVLNTVCLLGSLQVFERTSMQELREKSLLLTGYLELLLDRIAAKSYPITIITPRNPEERGCQLSILLPLNIDVVFEKMMAAGLVCDERKPNCIRLAPTPLYNRFIDVYRAAKIIEQTLKASS
jgi:kynureninase